MADQPYRARFDAVVTFTGGGLLRVEAYRIDLPGPGVTEAQIAQLFVASLGLLKVAKAEVSRVTVLPEEHAGSRGGPSDPSRAAVWVELNHVITEGMTTYPGLPPPTITPHLTREASRSVYAKGTEFAMDVIHLIGNTGTYLDSPYHRYEGGTDLAGLPLSSLVDLPAVVIRTVGSGSRAVDLGALAPLDVSGCAVLLHTGGDAHFGTPAYSVNAPYLTERGAQWLAEQGAKLVGIDSVNIDDAVPGGSRPAHSVLLAAGIPIVEHLTGLGQLPLRGARFTAAPPRVARFGTFPVRACARLP